MYYYYYNFRNKYLTNYANCKLLIFFYFTLTCTVNIHINMYVYTFELFFVSFFAKIKQD